MSRYVRNMYGGYAFLSEVPGFTQVNQREEETREFDTEVLRSGLPGYSNRKGGRTFGQELGLILVGALVFIVSFLWKDFISDLEKVILPGNPGLLGRFIYISVVTFIVIYTVVVLRNYLELAGARNGIGFDDSPQDEPGQPEDVIDVGDVGDMGGIGNGGE